MIPLVMVTGVVMALRLFGTLVIGWAVVLHFCAVGAVVCGLLIHVYMGAVFPEEKPAFFSMITGSVNELFAYRHHHKWWAVIKAEEREWDRRHDDEAAAPPESAPAEPRAADREPGRPGRISEMGPGKPAASPAQHPRHARRTSRRQVLWRILACSLAIPFLGSLVVMLRRVQATGAPATVLIPPDVSVGLSVVESVIVHRGDDGTIRVFSSRCTHLGCRIDRIAGDEAVCPCHGSRYRADGTVSAGPATRPLRRFRVEPDPASGGWIARAS